MPQVVQTLKSLSSVALLAVSQLCTTRSKRSGRSVSPYRLNHSALTRPPPRGAGDCLILASEIVLADRAADVREGGERLARGVQRLALLPGEALRSPDRLDLIHLVGFSDRWKAHHLPRLLPEHVADEVVLLLPLHDDDDGATAFVVEPTVESVEEPLIGGVSPRVGERLLRF